MPRTETMMGPPEGVVVASNGRSPWKVVVTALAFALVACALGWGTFQKDPGAWIPLGAAEGSVVDQ